jgi:hypothetical protein
MVFMSSIVLRVCYQCGCDGGWEDHNKDGSRRSKLTVKIHRRDVVPSDDDATICVVRVGRTDRGWRIPRYKSKLSRNSIRFTRCGFGTE